MVAPEEESPQAVKVDKASAAASGTKYIFFIEKGGIKDNSSAIMIGDREHDVIGARENGLDSIGVLYGYGAYDELKTAGATFIAAKPMDILKHV